MKRLLIMLVSALMIAMCFTGCTGTGNVSTSDDGSVNGTNMTESTGNILDTMRDDLSEMGDEIMTDATEDSGASHRSSRNGSGNGSSGSGSIGSGNATGSGMG